MQYAITRFNGSGKLYLSLDGMTPKWVQKNKSIKYSEKPLAEETMNRFCKTDHKKDEFDYKVELV